MRGRSLLPSWNWLNRTVAGVPTTGLPTVDAAQTPGRPFTTSETAYMRTCTAHHSSKGVAALRLPECRSQDRNPTCQNNLSGSSCRV